MWIVRLALRRPYTFVVMSVLIAILGGIAIFLMPTDIFPAIDIPVVSVVWNYSGISPEEMEKRIVTVSERTITTTVDELSASNLNHMPEEPLSTFSSILERILTRPLQSFRP